MSNISTKSQKESKMKKLLLLGLLLTSSMQANAFPHLMDYKVVKEVDWLENGKCQFVSFKENKAIKMNRVTSYNFNGFYGNCPVTNYNVYVTGNLEEAKVTISRPDKNIFSSKLIEYHLSESFLFAYFDTGFLTIFELEREVYFMWAEYIN